MCAIHADLDRIGTRGWQIRVPYVKGDRHEELLGDVDVLAWRRLECALDPGDLSAILTNDADIDLVRVGRLHLVNLEHEGEADAHRGRELLSP